MLRRAYGWWARSAIYRHCHLVVFLSFLTGGDGLFGTMLADKAARPSAEELTKAVRLQLCCRIRFRWGCVFDGAVVILWRWSCSFQSCDRVAVVLHVPTPPLSLWFLFSLTVLAWIVALAWAWVCRFPVR